MPRTFTPLKVAGLRNIDPQDLPVGGCLDRVSVTLTVNAIENVDESEFSIHQIDCFINDSVVYLSRRVVSRSMFVKETCSTLTLLCADCVYITGRCTFSDTAVNVRFHEPWAAVVKKFAHRVDGDRRSLSLAVGGAGISVSRDDKYK